MSAIPPGQETLVALVTRACPLDCVYCQFRRDPPPMDDALLRRCADLVLEAEPEGGTLIFLGGEPLTRLRQVLAAADYARERAAREFPRKRLSLAVTTNGLLLDDAALEGLLARGVRVQLSLDGGRQEAQRPARGGGDYPREKLDAAFERLRRSGADFSVHMVVSPEGLADFREDALRYLERGAPQVHVQYRVGVPWSRADALSFVRETARLGLEALARGLPVNPRELMDCNEPTLVAPNPVVDTDGTAYVGVAVPAMELILPRLKEACRLGDARTMTMAELAAAGAGARAKALALHPDDPERDLIVRSNLEMGDACLEAGGVLRRRLEAEGGRR